MLVVQTAEVSVTFPWSVIEEAGDGVSGELYKALVAVSRVEVEWHVITFCMCNESAVRLICVSDEPLGRVGAE